MSESPPYDGKRRGLLVLGSVNVDLVLPVAHIPTEGETVLGGDAVFTPGGKGGNQAVAAALAGAEVSLAGRVGEDAHAEDVRRSLRTAGVDVTHLQTVPGSTTGLAVVLVARDGENAIAVASGANHRLGPDDVERLRRRIGQARLMLLQMELPADVVVRACRVAAEVGTPVVLNLAPPARLPPEVLEGLAVLVVNRSEAGYLMGRHLSGADDLRRAAVSLQAGGPRTVVVTAGAEGAFVAHDGAVSRVPAQRVDVVDTSGAGDAFVGVLAARLTQGVELTRALVDASGAAAAAVRVHGARLTSLPEGTRH